MDQTQFLYLGRLTTVIAVSLVEAIALAGEGNLGRECRDRVSHTRALYNELLEGLRTVVPNGGEFARGLADSIGVRLEELERRTERADAQRHEATATVVPNGGEFARGLADKIGVPLENLKRRTERPDAQRHKATAKSVSPPADDRTELWHLWPIST